MNWYDDIKYEIPESLDIVKKEILSKIPLIEKKKILHKRLMDASRFFSNPGLSSIQIQEGNELLIQIVNEMIAIDDELVTKDINIVGALESRVIDLNVKARVSHTVNELQEPIDSVSVSFFNSAKDENLVQIGLEDAWYFKSIKKLFNIDANNIEIIGG